MWKKKIDKENKSLSWRSDILPAPTREIKSTKAKRYKTGRKERRVHQTSLSLSLSLQPLHAAFIFWKNDQLERVSEIYCWRRCYSLGVSDAMTRALVSGEMHRLYCLSPTLQSPHLLSSLLSFKSSPNLSPPPSRVTISVKIKIDSFSKTFPGRVSLQSDTLMIGIVREAGGRGIKIFKCIGSELIHKSLTNYCCNYQTLLH